MLDAGPLERGRESVMVGRYEEALAIYERALLDDPRNPDLWNGKGVALRSIGRYEDAAGCFARALEIDPRDRDSS